MNEAITQIREYIAGNQNARIECDDEGDLYRLFHEVNSLVTILNAHAENEGRAKTFLKDTISDISHQLKTPLAALNIYNGLMQQEVQNSSELKEFASLSEQELDRIESLVQNLLKITKLDAGTITLDKQPQNVADMMGYIERHFAYQAQQQEKTLVLSGDEEVALVCDQTWLIEAISNIVKNAFDHTKAGATIRLTWRAFASMVQIIVSDNGSGIHPEDLPHIFKRFYRSRFSKDTQGIGLGLPLAKAIIVDHMRAVGMDGRQLSKMILAEAFTYAFWGCIIGCAVGLPFSKVIYDFLITDHFPYASWSLPIGSLAVIVLFVIAAAVLAAYSPAKRMRTISVTETINEL